MLVGCLAGVIAGLLGVGGGLVIVPILLHIYLDKGLTLDYAMPLVLGTSLGAIIPTSIVSSYHHHLRKAVSFDYLKRFGIASLIGAFMGSSLAPQLGGVVLKMLFGTLVLFIAVRIIIKSIRRHKSLSSNLKTDHAYSDAGQQKSSKDSKNILNKFQLISHFAFFLTAFFSSLIGIGGGSFNVPLLLKMGKNIHQAVGTSAAFGLTIALPGTIGYLIAGIDLPSIGLYSVGFVDFGAMLILVPAMVLFAPLGVKLAHILPQSKLEIVFAVIISIVGTKLILQ